jgi:hypothetical protein
MAHLLQKHSLARINTALLLGMVWGGLALCAFGAIAYDLGRLFGRW